MIGQFAIFFYLTTSASLSPQQVTSPREKGGPEPAAQTPGGVPARDGAHEGVAAAAPQSAGGAAHHVGPG